MTQKATITQVKDAEWSSKRVYHQTGNVKRDTKPAPKPAPKPEPTPKPAPLTAPVTKEGEKMPSWIWIAVIGGILLVILLAIKKRK